MGGRIQVVCIVLSDGREGYFTGPAFVDELDGKETRVRLVRFFEPQPLPKDATFERIGNLLSKEG